MSSDRIWVLFNSRAGSAARFHEEFQPGIRQAGGRLCDIDRAESLEQLLAAAQDAGVQRVVVAGGDGTLHRVVNAIAPRFDALEFGLLPLGTGNDLARTLGIPSDAPEAALEIALTAPTRPIDVVQIRDPDVSYCINAAGAGFGGEVSAQMNAENKQRWGPLAYWMTALTQVVNMPQYRVRLQLDDQELDREIVGLVIANGRYIGGGFPIALDAVADDGLMNVIIIPVLPTLEMVAAGLNVIIDRWHRPEKVEGFLAKKLHVVARPELLFSVDGEPHRNMEATFEIMPHRVHIAAASDAEGFGSAPRTGE